MATEQASTLDVSPPGANDWTCKPSAEHPYPVILVPGIFESMAKKGMNATASVADSAQELPPIVDKVRSTTGARKVDLVAHSQGGRMPHYYMGFPGGAKGGNYLIGIAPSHHITEGVIVPSPDYTSLNCPSCADQRAGAAFIQELNSIGAPLGAVLRSPFRGLGPSGDSLQQPVPQRPRTAGHQPIQDKCPADVFEHDQMPNDSVVYQVMAHALVQASGPTVRVAQLL